MKRVALYVRVSTLEQKNHGQSVDSQIDALKAFSEASDYQVMGIYNDAGISARKRYKKRPALLQLLEDCEQGKIDLILFTKLDRWFRNVADYYEVQNILDKNHVCWRAIWEDYETETSAGVFKVNIMLSIAQAEADRTSERVKSVNDFRRAKGQIVYGRAPTGYSIVKSQLVIDKTHEQAVREGFRTFLSTSSSSEMQAKMKALGCVKSLETVSRMLKNPTYYGNAYGIDCPAYIAKEEFDRIQFVLENRKTRKAKSQKRVYLFGGLVTCASCGSSYHSQCRSIKSGDKKYYYKYYVCGRGRNGLCENTTSISEMKLEKILLDKIEERNKEELKSVEFEPKEVKNVTDQRQKLESRIKRIGDRYELGEIEREEYIQKINALRSELTMLQAPSPQKVEPLPDGWRAIYDSLDEKHKKIFWNRFLKNNIKITKEGAVL